MTTEVFQQLNTTRANPNLGTNGENLQTPPIAPPSRPTEAPRLERLYPCAAGAESTRKAKDRLIAELKRFVADGKFHTLLPIEYVPMKYVRATDATSGRNVLSHPGCWDRRFLGALLKGILATPGTASMKRERFVFIVEQAVTSRLRTTGGPAEVSLSDLKAALAKIPDTI